MSNRTTTGAAPELNPAKSACTGDAVLRTSTWDTVMMMSFICSQQCTFHPTNYVHQDIHPPNRQPVTVCEEERVWRGTTSSQTTTGEAPELRPSKSACTGDAVLRTGTRGTVPMGQCVGCHRGQYLTVHISTNDLHC